MNNSRFQTWALSLAALFTSTAIAFACGGGPGGGNGGSGIIIQSRDPNEMEGSLGYGDPDTQRFVLPGEYINYKIHFENMTNATASACEVRVTSALSDNLDWSTLEFSEVCLGSQTDTSFFGKKGGEAIVPFQGATYQLKMVFSLNESTGGLSCFLRAWDETQADQNYLPADVLAGILPPNDDTGRGEGYIAYRVKVKADAEHLARIDSSASIVFDSNAPITTDPAWWNSVYADLNVPAVPVVTQAVHNARLIPGHPSTLTAPDAVGFGMFAYQWLKDGEIIADATNRIYNISSATAADAGVYSVRIANIFGFATSQTFEVTLVDPYMSEPDQAAAVAVTTAYEGFVYDDNGKVRGMVSLSAKMSARTLMGVVTTNWAFSAKATLQNTTVSFSSKGWSGEEGALNVTTRTGETLSVHLGEKRFWGEISGGKVGGPYNVDGAKYVFSDRNDSAAQARLNNLRGLYNVALISGNGLSVQEPAGYLTLTVGNLGAVKIAGKVADGTAFSASAKLIDGLNADGWLAITLFQPLYMKKGFIGGLLWLNPLDGVIRIDASYQWLVDWVYNDPQMVPFAHELSVCGGKFGDGRTGVALAPAYTFYSCVPDTLPPPVVNLAGSWAEVAFPWDMPVSVSGFKLALSKATIPKKVGTGAEAYYDYTVTNSSCATISYSAGTGLFKGTFKLYYDGFDLRGSLQHKTISVSYSGVMAPIRDESYCEWPIASGIGTATINRQKVTMPVFLLE